MSELPAQPPPARAPAVLEQRPVLERELVDLKLQIAERVLAAYEGKPEAREKLAALDQAIRTVEFQIECNGLAHQLAAKLDQEVVAAWRRVILSDPQQATEGITKNKCCTMCNAATGCVITGVACAHPLLVGGVGPQHQGDPEVRAMYRSAAAKLGIPGYDEELEEEFEEEFKEVEEETAE